MTKKILKIQNKAKSLEWGCCQDENDSLFAVGHKSYPRQTKYFVVSKDFNVSIVTDDHKKDLVKSCSDESEVLKVVYELLSKWFPAKGGKSND